MSADDVSLHRRRPPCSWLPHALGVGLLAFTLGLACDRGEQTHYIVPKEPATVPAAMAGASAGAGEIPPPEPPRTALAWKLPKGWKETRGGGQMRYATLTPPVQGRVDVTVVVLPGPAGGELANVNRWRSQIGLPPLQPADLAGARKGLRAPLGEVALYDFTSSGTPPIRTVAGLTELEGSTWFVKMTGDAAAVASARPSFLELIGSLDRE